MEPIILLFNQITDYLANHTGRGFLITAISYLLGWLPNARGNVTPYYMPEFAVKLLWLFQLLAFTFAIITAVLTIISFFAKKKWRK